MNYELLDGESVINTIIASAEFMATNYPAGSYRQLPEPPAPVVSASVILTRLAFTERLTDEEMVAIYTAAKSDVRVEVWLDRFKISEQIDLTDQRLIDGIRYLEAASLLAAGRANEILAP